MKNLGRVRKAWHQAQVCRKENKVLIITVIALVAVCCSLSLSLVSAVL
jgi:hypothetical protein